MTELNLKCHFQVVRSINSDGEEEYAVHEAFSTESGELYMVSPVPVYIVGSNKEEISELTSMVEKDIGSYGTVSIDDIQSKFEKYAEYTYVHLSHPDYIEPDYSDEEIMNPEEEFLAEDFHDNDDKVIDLVDFMNRRR